MPRFLGIALAAATLAAGLVAAGGARGAADRLTLRIDTPEPGRVATDDAGMVFVAGSALAHSGELPAIDVVFALDVSLSTADSSGADVDGDGRVSRGGGGFLGLGDDRDNPDSILAAELAAVRTLLDQLDSRTTRVGIVIFSGDGERRTPDAFVEVPLTRDYEEVREGLDALLLEGPNGGTNMHAGVLRGTVELLGSRSASSMPREGAQRILMFLTDGIPTLPDRYSGRRNADRAIEAASLAARSGVRIHTFAIGKEATREPRAPLEMARVTGGTFTPVEDPRDIQAAVGGASFADIETLRIRNATTDASAPYVVRNPDGTYSGLVPAVPGRNVIEVFARSTQGVEETRTVAVELQDGSLSLSMSERQRADLARLRELRRQDAAGRARRERDVEVRTEDAPAADR